MKKILVINGPNLNLLGLREPDIYGNRDYKALEAFILENGLDLGLQVETFQSNHEGAIVDKIQQAYGVFDGIVINPAAYTHTSVAILDALKAVAIPTVEVHLHSQGRTHLPGCKPYQYHDGGKPQARNTVQRAVQVQCYRSQPGQA